MACLASSNSRGLPVMPEIVPVVPGTAAVTPAAIAPAAIAPTTVAPATVAPADVEIGPLGGKSDGIGMHIDMGVLIIDAGDSGANFAEAIGDAGDVVVRFEVGRRRFRGGGRQGGRNSEDAGGQKDGECFQGQTAHGHSRSPRL